MTAAPVYQYSTLTSTEQAALASGVITAGLAYVPGGRHLAELEQAAARRIGRAAAVAVDSGSAALALAVRGLRIGPGHEVIIPEAGWVSIGAAAADAGAAVRVAPVTESLTPGWEQIEPLLTPATAAVVLAHLRGRPAPETARIAAELSGRGIALIEDCAQAWGVTAAGRPAGARGTAAVFSTQAFKLISTGEGGLLLADDPVFAGRVRALAGDTRQAAEAGLWRGKRRMTDLSAALARPQLARLDELTAGLRRLQHHVVEALTAPDGIRAVVPALPDIPAGNGSQVGLWLSTAEQAGQLATAYHRAGLRSWRPGPGDLHTAAAWPAQPSHRIVSLPCYIDIQIPWLPTGQHADFAAAAAAVTAKALRRRVA